MSRRTTVPDLTDPSAVVGTRIRELRRARGLTLQALGAETGLTHAFLSQVERGLARPSLRSAARIASALGVAIGSLVQPEAPGGLPLITRASETPGIGGEPATGGAVIRAVTAQGHVLQGTVSEGFVPLTQTLGHAGEELVHVIEGTLGMTIDSERHVLERGDTIVFDGRVPHTYEGLGPEPPVFLIVVANAGRDLPPDGPWRRDDCEPSGQAPEPG